MEILITSPSIHTKDNVSGISNLTRLLVENNAETKYQVFIAGKKDSDSRNLRWLIQQFLIIFSFVKQVSKKDIDIIHINMPQEKLAIIRDYFFALICRGLKKNYLIHLRGGAYNLNPCMPKFYKYLINVSIKGSEKMIVLGNREKSYIAEYYNILPWKIEVLPNCVKTPDRLASKYKEGSTLNILYLGRIDKNKGLKEILEAFSNLPVNIKFKLHVAGDGPDREWFIQRANEFLKKRFEYKGVVSGSSKISLLSQSHVFILPSYFEGLPNALLEAMSYGIVPVVTPVGSMPEVVSDKFNGIIIPVKDYREISDAIIRLYNDRNMLNEMSSNAARTIKESYSIEGYIEKLNLIYYEMINSFSSSK